MSEHPPYNEKKKEPRNLKRSNYEVAGGQNLNEAKLLRPNLYSELLINSKLLVFMRHPSFRGAKNC